MIADLAADMSLTLGVWAIAWVVFIGLGLLAHRGLRVGVADEIDVLLSFWLGWAATVALLQIWNLILPVDWRCRLLLLGLGVGGLVIGRNDLVAIWAQRRSSSRVQSLVAAGATVLFALLLANHALSVPNLYDTGAYHLQSVRWAEAYPIVPGLANLDWRFGMNNSYFLYVALIDVGLLSGESYRLANGLLLLAMFVPLAWSVRSGRARARPVKTWCRLTSLFLLTPLVDQAVRGFVPSPTPDLAVICLAIAQFCYLMRLLARSSAKQDHQGDPYLEALAAVALLAAVGATVKLSFVVLGWSTLLLVAVLGGTRSGFAWKRAARVTIVLSLIVIVPWSVRGVILSGYPLYPSTFVRVQVEWQLPQACLHDVARHIKGWARSPNAAWSSVLDNWSWLNPWAQRMSRKYQEVVLPLGLVVAACGLSLARPRARVEAWAKWAAIAIVPAVASVVFWFCTAPDPRFALASFWIIGAAVAARAVARTEQPSIATAAIVVAVVLGLIPLHRARVVTAREALPQPEFAVYVTDSGLSLRVPRGQLCWDAPLPCTAHPNGSLMLRDGNHLASGFVALDPASECGG